MPAQGATGFENSRITNAPPGRSTRRISQPAPRVLQVAQAKRDRQRIEAVIGKRKIQSIGFNVSDGTACICPNARVSIG